MCNACGNMCCGSDKFGSCGCDGCDEQDCWSDEPEDDDGEWDVRDDEWRIEAMDCCAPQVGRFRCQGVEGPAL